MPPAAATAVGLVVLVGVLVFAAARPLRLPEAVAAVPAALLLVALGLVGPDAAAATVGELGPTVAFLAAVLVIAHLADVDGLFRWIGAGIARRAAGSAQRVLALVFCVAAATTAVLSLDATVVLLTPVVIVTVRRLTMRPAPHLYATAHLANTGSLLLPVSNLTNLLAFHVSGLTFLGFAGWMSLPWLGAIAVEYLVFRWYFRHDLAAGTTPPAASAPPHRPLTSLTVVGLVLVGLAGAPLLSVPPWVVAAVGAAVLAGWALWTGSQGLWRIVGSAHPAFLLFVLALGVIVQAATDHGLRSAIADLLPDGTSWAALLLLAAISAVAANLLNNLPATLVLLAALQTAGAAAPAAVLAILVGVNIGPNVTYTGSLATLLWRRVLQRDRHHARLGTFTRLGLLTVPPSLVVAVTLVWALAPG